MKCITYYNDHLVKLLPNFLLAIDIHEWFLTHQGRRGPCGILCQPEITKKTKFATIQKILL